VELLRVRSRGEPASTLYPQPGEVRDSILLAHSDGVPTVFAMVAVLVRPARVVARPAQRVDGLHASLIVTDRRSVFASSAYAPHDEAMLVGQVRHCWLTNLTVRADGLRLAFTHPLGGRLVAAVTTADAADHRRAAAEIADRSGLWVRR
jgi:hypothetical protein